MDKRKEANFRVKNSITKALLKLMHEKSFSDISISELILTAGVARASFYRNYSSKEDVLHTLVDDVLEEFRQTVTSKGREYYTYQNVRRSFEFFKEYGNFVLDLYQFGYGTVIMEKLNRFHEQIVSPLSDKPIERYSLYMYIGALYNTAVMWLQNGTREDIENITGMFCAAWGIPGDTN